MWWCKRNAAWGRLARLAVVLAAAGLTAGCFQPLYGTQPSAATDSVRDKLAQIDVPMIPAPKGQPAARIAVALRNSLQYGLNGAAGANAPTYTLKVIAARVGAVGHRRHHQRPAGRAGRFHPGQLPAHRNRNRQDGVERFEPLPMSITIFPARRNASPSSARERDAEDRATEVVSEAIRNRLASYFVAGT